MINGEKLCIDFPNMGYVISGHRVITTIGVANSFDLDWWNAEYEEPNSSKIPTGSDTKNDLGVNYIVDVLGSYTDLDIPYKREIAENILTKLPPVRLKGHWINKYHADEDGLDESCSAECSSCHKRSNGYAREDGYGLKFMYYGFCPKCGSDNREVEE